MSGSRATSTITDRFESSGQRHLESDAVHRVGWFLALLLFGVGDLVTTIYFIVEFGAVETHPVGGPAIDVLGFWGLVPLKAIAFGVCYGLYRLAPREYAVGVPIGLILLGGWLSVWNTAISLTGSAPL